SPAADRRPPLLRSHDTARVGHLPQAARAELHRAELAHPLIYLPRGQPVVYHGHEQGYTPSGGDKAARQSLFASQVQQYQQDRTLDGDPIGTEDNFATTTPMYERIAELGELRSQHPALRSEERRVGKE